MRKRKAPAPKMPQPVSGLDLVQNFASLNQKQEQGNNNIVNTVPATTTNTNFIITPTTNNSLHNFFLSNQGQTMVQNQQVINFLNSKSRRLKASKNFWYLQIMRLRLRYLISKNQR